MAATESALKGQRSNVKSLSAKTFDLKDTARTSEESIGWAYRRDSGPTGDVFI